MAKTRVDKFLSSPTLVPKIRPGMEGNEKTEKLWRTLERGGFKVQPVRWHKDIYGPEQEVYWHCAIGDSTYSVFQDSAKEGGGYTLHQSALPVSHDRFESLEACGVAVENCVLQDILAFLVEG